MNFGAPKFEIRKYALSQPDANVGTKLMAFLGFLLAPFALLGR
jgi:hypothetical protein